MPNNNFTKWDAVTQSVIFAFLWGVVLSVNIYVCILIRADSLHSKAQFEIAKQRHEQHDRHVQASWDWLRNFVNEHTAKTRSERHPPVKVEQSGAQP